MVSPINNIANNQLSILPVQNNRIQLVAIAERRIENIDREINARERYVKTLDNHIKLLQESKALDQKRINAYQNTNTKLQALLDRKTPRSKSVEPVRTSKLEEAELKSSLPKGTMIKEQSAKIEDRINKHDIAINYAEQRIAKLSDSGKAKDGTVTSVSNKKEGLANSYKPVANYIREFKTSGIQENQKSSLSALSIEQQRYIVQSQANILDSIISANIHKFI